MNRGVIVCILLLLGFVSVAQELDSLKAIAYKNNPGLQARYKQFEAAMTRVNQVNKLADPTLSFGYFISPVETRVGPQRARISLSQKFPWFGTLKLRGNVEAIKAEWVFQEFLDARNDLGRQVAKTYFELEALRQKIEVRKSNLEILKSWKTLTTSQFENNKASLADVLKIELKINEQLTEIEILESGEEPLVIELNRTVNQPDSTNVSTSFKVETTTDSIPEFQGDQIPKLVALRHQQEVYRLSEEVIQKQSLPKIGAGIDYVIVSERNDMAVEDNGRDVVMPMVSISLPIFRKKYTAALEENEIMQASYVDRISEMYNSLYSEYAKTKYRLDRESDLKTLYETQMEETRRIRDLELAAFRNGTSDLNDLLMIQNQILDYQTKLVDSNKNILSHKADLEYLLAVDL